jgi:hypothetical protein
MSPAQTVARRAADAYFARLETALAQGRQPLLPSPATAAETSSGTYRQRWAKACHADLAHARNDWARLVVEQGAGWCQDEQATWGAHPSERYRLAHEWSAAAVLRTLGHLIALDSSWHAAKRWRPVDQVYLRELVARRSVAWAKFLACVVHYKDARAQIDRSGRLRAAPT